VCERERERERERGLSHQLIQQQAGWWRDAASLAEKLTKRSRWPHERLHFKMCLIVALAKTRLVLLSGLSARSNATRACIVGSFYADALGRVFPLMCDRQYRKAMDELDSLGDLEGPANFYESYPNLYQDRHGSMVPFSLLVLRAEMPSFVGSSDGLARSLDALFGLLECCRTQLSQLATNAPTSAASAASSEPSTLNKADLDALSALTVSQQVPSALSFINDLDQGAYLPIDTVFSCCKGLLSALLFQMLHKHGGGVRFVFCSPSRHDTCKMATTHRH